ncbi:MAG: hypothetical protein ACRDQZ_17010, partial [Mycobacteriales bacterium]
VIGHGDAHFGNVFLEGIAPGGSKRFLYFDPAFAGRHSVLLDVVKPLFHNVFAQWMYFPEEKVEEIPIRLERDADGISIEYSDAFPPLRAALLERKWVSLVEPLVSWLEGENALPHGRRPIDLALMCCPLLTMNLTDGHKFPAPMSWLGFALALQMGNGDIEQDFAF